MRQTEKQKLNKKLISQEVAARTSGSSDAQADMPLFMMIEQYLMRGIQEGKFSPERRLPSEAELTRKFNISRMTVVRAMHELRSRGLIERRAGSGTYIRKNPPAAKAGSFKIGLVVSGLGNTEILDPICTEISRCAQSRGHELLLGHTAGADAEDYSPEQALLLAQRYIADKVSGVIFAPLELPEQRAELNQRIALMLREAGIAVILLDRDIADFPGRSDFDLVGIDNFAAGYVIGSHLVEKKARRICFLARPRFPGTTDLRVAGARESFVRAGYSDRYFQFMTGDPANADVVRQMLALHKPDAVICANDRTAAMLMQTLSTLNLRVPQDLAVAAFDDVRYATLLSTPLTTMRQPCRDIALATMQMMIDRIEQPALPARQMLLTSELMIRRSTEWER